MDEPRFWAIIDEAWRVSEWDKKLRRVHPPARLDDETGSSLETAMIGMLDRLHEILVRFSADELLAWDAEMDRLLDDLDNDDVYDLLQGSYDGFLYRRCFVVGMGQRYYELVRDDPASAEGPGGWPECEEFGVATAAMHAYEERYGEWPGRG